MTLAAEGSALEPEAGGQRLAPGAAGPPLLGLLATAVFMVTLDTRAVAPLLPAMARDFGESVALTGLVVTAFSLPFAIFQLLYGPLGDRFGRLRVISIAFGGFVLGTGLSGLAPSLPLLFAVRALDGAVSAAIFPLSLAHIGDTVPYQRRQSAVGVLGSTSSAAQVLSVSIGGMVGEFLNWRLLYGLFCLLAAGTWIALLRSVRAAHVPPPRPAAQPSKGWMAHLVGPFARVYRVPGAPRMMALVFVETTFLFGGFAYMGAAIHERFGVSLLVVGFLLTGYGVGAFATAQAIGRLVRAFGERGLMLVGGILMASGFGLAEVLPRWELGFLAAVLMGCGFSCSHTTLQTIMTELAPPIRGTVLAMHAFHTMAGQAFGAAVLGGLLAWSGGYDALQITCALGLVAFGVVGSTVLPTRR